MAAQSAPATWNFDLAGQLKRRIGVGPQNWDHFAAAADDSDGKAYVPPSGANVTLKDLARDPASISFPSNDDPAVRAAVEDDGGWVGTPDPTKFAPGTTHLSPRELREEIEKGNVMLWKTFKQSVSELTGEDREAMDDLVQKRIMQERLFVTLKDGSKVSLWDLHQYVYNNPELEALYERRRRFPVADPEDPVGRSLPVAPASGLERSAGRPIAVMAPEEAEDLELDWGHVASGSMWRRRPTRWLRGLDGVKDWDMEVYTHEPMTNQVLGPKYGGRDPYGVIQDPLYAQDVVRCGPLLGMTFVLTAARDIPLQDMASTWRDLMSSYLQRQAPLSVPRRLQPTTVDPTDLNGVTWPSRFLEPSPQQRAAEEAAGCDELGVSWRQMDAREHELSVQAGLRLIQSLPSALCPTLAGREGGSLSGTPLVDGSGRSWRKGGALWLTLEPEGGVVLQAQSAGLVGDQESYLLARLDGQEALSGAVMEAFLGPLPVDPEMAATARSMLLLPANGFMSGNKGRDPNHPMFGGSSGRLPKVPSDPSSFNLAAKDQTWRQQGGTLLSGIRDFKLAGEVRSLLERASEASAEVARAPSSTEGSVAPSEGDEAAAHLQRGREEAARVLRDGMEALGPDARKLLRRAAAVAASPAGGGLLPELRAAQQPEGQLVSDLFSLARTLDTSDDE